MLKYFYKTLLVSILCGSLLLLDFSYKGSIISMNSARAETLKTDAVGGESIMATLTMTGIGLLASRLWSYKMTTDIMIAAAGGVAYIAGDIIAVAKNSKAIKEMEMEIKRDDKGNVDQKQIETLEKLKKSYQTAKDTANTKKMLQMAAAAAFAAAGVMAYMMAATEETQQIQCLLGLQNAASTGYAADMGKCQAAFAACTPPCTGPQAPACIAACTTQLGICNAGANACKAKIAADVALMTNYIAAREAPSPSATGLATTTSMGTTISSSFPASASACTPYGAAQFASESGGACPMKTSVDIMDASGGSTAGLMVADLQSNPSLKNIFAPMYQNRLVPIQPKRTLFDEAIKMFIPTAEAGLFSPLGIASGLAIKFILASNASLANVLDLNLLIPKRRAIAWGILAGLTFAASSATGSEIQKIESNIQKIDAILNQMYSYQNGVVGANTPSVSNPKIEKTIAQNRSLGINGETLSEVDLKAQGTNVPCFTGEESDKCPSFSNKLNAQADFKSMPDTMQAQIGSITKMADGLNGTSKISASTLSEVKSLANQANALSSDLAKKQKEFQEKLKAAGSKMDLAKEGDKLRGDLNDAIQNELNKNKMTASQMLASYGSGLGSGSSSGSAAATDANKTANDKNAKKGAGFAIPVVAIPSAVMPKIDDKALADSLKADADKAAQEAALSAEAAAKSNASMDEYELKNDITKDKESSIFDLISNRYQKSGYPRLFKRIK